MDDGATPSDGGLRPPSPPTSAASAADDGEPAAPRPMGAVLSANPPRNARQVLMVLGTMAVFFVGLVIVASWAAGHG